MGFIDFTNGEVLTADQMDLVMRQGIMRFADASARDTALSEVLAEGMMAYLDDTDEVLKYDGTNWIDISGDITGVTAGTALTGGGTSGNVTLDVDESALTIAQSQVTDLTTDLADKQDDVITTQGDIVIGDASGNPVRLPVGAADTVLTSDGTTVGFAAAAGGGGAWTLVDSGAIPTGSRSFTISGIDGYKDYILFFYGLVSADTGKVFFRPQHSGGAYTQSFITQPITLSTDDETFRMGGEFSYSSSSLMTIGQQTTISGAEVSFLAFLSGWDGTTLGTLDFSSAAGVSNDSQKAAVGKLYAPSAQALTSVYFQNAQIANFTAGNYEIYGRS